MAGAGFDDGWKFASPAAEVALSFALVVAGLRAGAEDAPPVSPPKPTPPAQPAKGFGGADYPHAAYRVTSLGQGGEQVWIFEPAEPVPREPAPVVIFLHGWSALDPAPYGGWIRHLVRRGNVVLYPRYQEALATPPAEFTPAMLAGVRAAWERLEKAEKAVRPDPARVTVVGHSFGGALTMQYAALAAKEKLPVPRALMAVEPGTGEERFPRLGFDFADMSAIPKETLLLMIVGDQDRLVADVTARKLWKRTAHIPAENRSFLTFRSDDHGVPPLLAGHLFPLAADDAILDPSAPPHPTEGRVFGADALDWRGTWRLFDALESVAFAGKGREQCLGGTDAQKDFGTWSDGMPVKPPEVLNDP